MSSVYFDPAVGGDGSTVSDDANPSTGLANGGHRTRFVPALGQVVAVAGNVTTKAATVAAQAAQVAIDAAAVATAADNFDDRYLGPKASDPTLDNDGNALQEGAFYWNTTSKQQKVWNGTAWVVQTFVPTAASGVSASPVSGGFSSTTVQGALDELSDAVVVVTATSQAAVSNRHYVVTNVAATTVTLPASPNAGDVVMVTVANGLTTNVIARNAKSIMGLAEDMTIDNANVTVSLRYLDATRMWRII